MRSVAASSATVAALVTGTAALALAGCTFNPSGSRLTGGGGTGGGTGGAGGGGPVLPGLQAIRVEPTDATVTVGPGAPAMQAFKAFGTFASGPEQDITARVTWAADRPLLVPSVAGGLARTGDQAGGLVVVRASAFSAAGTARLHIKYAATNVATGAGATPPLPTMPGDRFGGAVDPARAPQLVYPNEGVLLPPNMNGIEVHYRKGPAANTLFEIAFHNDQTDVRVYTRCVTLEDGCAYKPDATVWRQIAETNRGLGALAVSVRGTDDAGAAVGSSAAVAVSFSKDDVRGGLYYWSTTRQSIQRWDFGSTTQTAAETVVGPADGDGSTCVGCHALSRDGTKMVATLGGQNDGRILLWDVARKTAMAKPFTQQRSQFESWSPDGSQFVGMYTDNKPNRTGPSDLILFDGTTALATGSIPLGGLRADHPDWSPDGARIVFTSVDTAGSYTDQKPQKSGLAFIQRAAGAWGAPATLLPRVTGKNRYYPAIAPSGQMVIFNESTCPSGDGGADCDADTDPTATLYALPFPPPAAGGTPVALARANAPGVNDNGNPVLTNTYAKWSPFVFQLDEQHQVMWTTFSSKRRYGLYPDRGLLYVWMAAVQPDTLGGGGDPSHAAFCLPFQQLDTSNHIAQWTTSVPVIE